MAPAPIFVVSDGTGGTAERVLRAALLQFPDASPAVQVFPGVQDAGQLADVVARAGRERALVVATLVEFDMRRALATLAKEQRVTAVDLIGQLMEQLGTHLRVAPDAVPGRMAEADDDYFRRIEAIAFTVRADDGREPALVPGADVVIVGIPGTAKTPLAIHLAEEGWCVANVPVRPGRPLPAELGQVDPRRVFAVTIDPAVRAAALGPGGEELLRRVTAEVEFADEVFRRHPEWPVIDVTGKPVQETAAIVRRILRERGLGRLPR